MYIIIISIIIIIIISLIISQRATQPGRAGSYAHEDASRTTAQWRKGKEGRERSM